MICQNENTNTFDQYIDIMDYLNKPYINENENLINFTTINDLTSYYKCLIDNLHKLNTYTYDYISAAEEEYDLNGKLINNSQLTTTFAYLNASYYHYLYYFDVKKCFYENKYDYFYNLNEFNNEFNQLFNSRNRVFDRNNSFRKINKQKNSKWDVKSVNLSTKKAQEVNNQTNATIMDDIFERIKNLNASTIYECNSNRNIYNSNCLKENNCVSLVVSTPLANKNSGCDTQLSSSASSTSSLNCESNNEYQKTTRNWTVAPKIINNTNMITNKSQDNSTICKNNDRKINDIEPIGTKRKSNSKVFSNNSIKKRALV